MYKHRHSSDVQIIQSNKLLFVGGSQAEQATIDSIVRQRRTSIMAPQPNQTHLTSSAGNNPHIMVSEASVNGLQGLLRLFFKYISQAECQ